MPYEPHAPTGTDRYLPLSGVAFTALMIASGIAFPLPPGGAPSPASAPAWLAVHYNGVIGQSYVRALAALAFLALAAAVGTACRRGSSASSPLPALAVAGGLFSGGLLLAAQAVTLAAAMFVRDGGGADTVRMLGSLQTGLLNMSAIPAVLLFGATGVWSLRTGLLPRWLAIFSLLGVPAALVDAGSYPDGPLQAVGMLGLVYFLAWALLLGVRLSLVDGAPAALQPNMRLEHARSAPASRPGAS